LFCLLPLLIALPTFAQQKHPARGLVLGVDKQHRIMTVSCEAIPGYMDAMIMPIEVRDAKELAGLARGAMIKLFLVADKEPYAERLDSLKFDSLELAPVSARRLRLLAGAMNPACSPDRVDKSVEEAPDYQLLDRDLALMPLPDFTGKVVNLTSEKTRRV